MSVRAAPAPKFVAGLVFVGSWVLAAAGCGQGAGMRPSISEDVSPLSLADVKAAVQHTQALAWRVGIATMKQEHARSVPRDSPFALWQRSAARRNRPNAELGA